MLVDCFPCRRGWSRRRPGPAPHTRLLPFPPARGWTRLARDLGDQAVLLPTPAGTDPRPPPQDPGRGLAPRACGGGPSSAPSAATSTLCSPLAGTDPSPRSPRAHRPACSPPPAGMVPSRGVGPVWKLSVPLARTWSRPRQLCNAARHLLPAHAGDGPSAGDARAPPTCCSPRAQVWPPAVGHGRSARLLFPVRAGMDPAISCTPLMLLPPARGWTRLARPLGTGRPLLPARAGMPPRG